MRHIFLGFLAGALFLVGACFDSRAPVAPSIPGPLQTAPPATGTLDPAQQALIAGGANAKALGNTAGAKAAASALKTEDAEKTQGQVRDDVRPLYFVGALLLALAGYLLFSGNMTGATRAGAVGGSLIAAAIVTSWASDHRNLLLVLGTIAGVAELVYHYRSQLKVKSLALEHALATGAHGVFSWAHTVHPVAAVEKELKAAWTTVTADAHAVAAKLHLVSTATTLQAPGAPPAAPPVIITPTMAPIVAPAKPPTTITTP